MKQFEIKGNVKHQRILGMCIAISAAGVLAFLGYFLVTRHDPLCILLAVPIFFGLVFGVSEWLDGSRFQSWLVGLIDREEVEL